jgi:predicted DCC family thiol-disulfide oxidoreductase YuxK
VNTDKPVILFDGVCNLCSKSVQFVIKRDPEATFSYASLQSEFGQNLLKQFNQSPVNFNSFVLYQDNQLYTRSTGALKMLSQLKGWKWTTILFIIPRFLRDAVYNIISKYRYRWFGKKDECMIPAKEWKARFLD